MTRTAWMWSSAPVSPLSTGRSSPSASKRPVIGSGSWAPLEQKLILGYEFRTVIMKSDLSQMEQATDVALADHTTLRVGGAARRMIIAETETELIETLRELDAAGEPLVILGGGSTLLVGDSGFDGTVIKIATRGVDEDTAACSGAVITVAAGAPWGPRVGRGPGG